MKIRKETTYYFTAIILRDNVRAVRQGTMNAESPLEAIERVYDMGKTVWEKPVVEITIADPVSGASIATSRVGDKVHRGIRQGIMSLPAPDKKKEEKQTVPEKGFIPWGERDKAFMAHDIGTYFNPIKFNKLAGM